MDVCTSRRAHYARTGGCRTKPRHLHHHACRHGRTLVRWLNEPWPLSRGRGRTRRRLAASTITNGASGHAELADFALPFAYGGGFRVALETRIVVDGAVSRMSRILSPMSTIVAVFQLFELAEARNGQKCPFPPSNLLDRHPPNPNNNLAHAHNSNILDSMDVWEANSTISTLHIQHFCLLHTSFLCILRLRSEGPIRPMEAGVGPISRVKCFTNNGPRKPHTEFYACGT